MTIKKTLNKKKGELSQIVATKLAEKAKEQKKCNQSSRPFRVATKGGRNKGRNSEPRWNSRKHRQTQQPQQQQVHTNHHYQRRWKCGSIGWQAKTEQSQITHGAKTIRYHGNGSKVFFAKARD